VGESDDREIIKIIVKYTTMNFHIYIYIYIYMYVCIHITKILK
jgi:hypothetical protein